MSALRSLRNTVEARLPDACLVSLRLAGWSAVTLLAALGCFVLFFIMLGDFSAEGFFAQLDNLASRFVEAQPGRRAQFLNLAAIASGIVLAAVAISRRHSLGAVFRAVPEDHPMKGHADV